jgi:hypothetical protein
MPQRMRPFPFLAGLALLLPVEMRAGERLIFGNPEHFCRNGAFPGGGEYAGDKPTFKIAEVKGASAALIHFLEDDDGSGQTGRCPRADNPNCRQPAFARAGDRVIVSKTSNGFACAWQQPAHGAATVGWLPLNRLTILDPDPQPPLERWIGTWWASGRPLSLRQGRTPGSLEVEGESYWPGPNLPNTHFGTLEGSGAPVENILVIQDPSAPEAVRCVARLSLVGDMLIVSDNHKCGGLNVSFDGVYQK